MHVYKNQNYVPSVIVSTQYTYHGIMVALEFEQNELRTVGHVFCKYRDVITGKI